MVSSRSCILMVKIAAECHSGSIIPVVYDIPFRFRSVREMKVSRKVKRQRYASRSETIDVCPPKKSVEKCGVSEDPRLGSDSRRPEERRMNKRGIQANRNILTH